MVAGSEAAHTTLAIELLRALRGRRSQTAFSKFLGYRSNVAQRWESGHALPTAPRFLDLCSTLRLDVNGCFEHFYGRAPGWLADAGCRERQVAAFLNDLRGKVPVNELARRLNKNRFSVARWLGGQGQPRLDEFFELIEVSSGRLPDFIAGLVDPATLPSLASKWSQLERARAVAYEIPWSHAVLRALELPEVAAGGGATESWLMERLGISGQVLDETLSALQHSGQIEQRGERYQAARMGDVDTGADPVRARRLKAHWAGVALERLQLGGPGLFGYSLFTVAREDLQRIRDLQLEYVQQINTIVAESSGEDCVGLFCTQVLDLSECGHNALAPSARRDGARPRRSRRPRPMLAGRRRMRRR
ncbi:MAG: helix-turn-helix domain-containing protein [Myxococcales bacterium]|nr:helix-turn-helix domain-containing protein [Myxococcales bacterium]